MHNDSGTATKIVKDDDGRQLSALIALSKHLGASPVIRINESADILMSTDRREGRAFNSSDLTSYRKMISDAKAQGVDLIFADKNGNILSF